MEYTVGDIVWVVLSRRPGLVVLQVSEQITKKTLRGVETTYHLIPMNAREKKNSVITLDQIPGDIYRTRDDARAAMIAAATSAIDDMINDAQEALDEKITPTPVSEPNLDVDDDTADMPDDFVILPDGTRARLNIPTEVKEAIG